MSRDLAPCRKEMEVTCTKVVCTLFCICTYVGDVALDILVAIVLFRDGEYVYFGLTVLLIASPSVVMTAFSVWWYLADEESEPFKTSRIQWVTRVIFLVLLMAPVVRNLEALYYASKSANGGSQRRNYVRRMAYENVDASTLRLFQAFIESAPQATLQLHIVGGRQYGRPNSFSETDVIQLFCVFTSLLSLPCAVASYQINLRESTDHKNDFDCSVAAFPFLWRFCELTSRLLALGLFSSIFLAHATLFFVIHSFIMFVWTRVIGTDVCGNKPGELLYNLLLSYIYFFCFLNPVESRARGRYLFYYCLIFAENAVLVGVWYAFYLPLSSYRLLVLVTVTVTCALAVLIMVFYYALLHPTRGRFFGRPSPIRVDETLDQVESIAREFGLPDEIIDRFRRERENIPMRKAEDVFRNVIPTEWRSITEESQV